MSLVNYLEKFLKIKSKRNILTFKMVMIDTRSNSKKYLTIII